MGFSRAIEAIAMERVRKHIKKVSFDVNICGFHGLFPGVSVARGATKLDSYCKMLDCCFLGKWNFTN